MGIPSCGRRSLGPTAARTGRGAIAVLAVLVTSATPALGACPTTPGFDFTEKTRKIDEGKVVETATAVPVAKGPGDSLMFSGRMRVNTDGAPNSYHPLGQAAPGLKPLNFVCNAIAVELPGDIRLSAKTDQACAFITKYYVPTRESGWRISPGYTIKWYAIAHKPNAGGRYQPCIQQAGRFKGFFVSQTKLATGLAPDDDCDVAHWANSLTLPYITLPSGSAAFDAAGAEPGDLALVTATVGGVRRTVVAVVADKGNSDELGEGSVALHRMLRGQSPDPEWTGNAYGLDLAATSTILFPKRSATPPITAASLQATRQALVAALGGEAVLESCAR